MKMRKKWIPDTKIARKLHDVLDSKDGEILIEVEDNSGALSIEDLREAMNNMYQSMNKSPNHIIVSPKTYSDLLSQVNNKKTWQGAAMTVPNVLKIDNVDIVAINLASDDTATLVDENFIKSIYIKK